MALGSYADFVIDDQYFHTGLFEGLTQNLNLFNGASMNTIRLVSDLLPGHYNHRITYKTLEDAVSRRDITSQAAITSADTTVISENDQIGVKLNRKLLIKQTLDSFKKNFDPGRKGDYQEMSQWIGRALAPAILKDQLNDALAGLRAAIKNQSASLYTQSTVSTGSGKLISDALVGGLKKMGDASGKVKCWIMHSTPYWDLVKNQSGTELTGVADIVLYGGSPATFGKPVLVTDSASLYATIGSGSSAYTEYYTLGLVEDAAVVTQSENPTLAAQLITGEENLRMNLQGEQAHNLEILGFKWDIQNGGMNPSDAALATGTNWDLAMSNVKNRAGVCVASK